MNIVIVSPHRDDAAFSLSISIRHWLDEGHAVRIVNVFTRSEYAPYGDMRRSPAEDRVDSISGLRKLEDERFLQAMRGAAMVDLELEDAPIRLGCESSIVCTLDVQPADEALSAIHERVLQLLVDHEEAVLVLPLALGRHVDHCTARDAVLSLVTNYPCAFYEDLPYALREGARHDLSELRSRVSRQHQTDIFPALCDGIQKDAVEFKRGMALLYASQVDAEEVEPIAEFSRRYDGRERLWANAKWIAVAEGASLSKRQEDPEGNPLPA